MQLRRILTVALAAFFALSLTMVASAQDGNFMVRYATNLNPAAPGVASDTVVNITNTGASFGLFYPLRGGGFFQNVAGFVCANVYVYSADEQLQECCSCNLSPNALGSFSAIGDLISNTLTTAKPNSIVIKIVGTAGSTCNPATAGQTDTSVIVAGLVAWARNAQGGETAFSTATLTQSELTRATSFCAFNQINGSGTGVCKKVCKADGQ